MFKPFTTLAVAAVLSAAMATSSLAGTPAQDFAVADADKSGGLNATEFRRYIALSAEAGRGNAIKIRDGNHYDRAFSKIDKNRDGQIVLAEIDTGA